MKKISIFLVIICLICGPAESKQLTASYYTVRSAIQESGQYRMANGKPLCDFDYTCASLDYPFETLLKITNTDTGHFVFVRVTDRGPNKKLYDKGRVIDLSKIAFKKLAPLSDGVIPIRIEVIGR